MQENPQYSELCLTSTNINIHFYLHDTQMQQRVASLVARKASVGPKKYTHALHTQDSNRVGNLHKDNYHTVD